MPRNLSNDICPECEVNYLTRPIPSVGFHTAEHEHRVYQKCPGHIFKAGSQCQFFRWRDDLSPPPWGNIMSTPSKKKQATPCTSLRCSSAPKARGSHQKCSQGFCKECCLGTSVQCTVLTHNTPASGPSALEVVPAQSFARMIPLEYGIKIAQGVFTVSPSARMQTEAYRMEAKHTITIKFWAEDNKRPIVFVVPTPGYPHFHPKDCAPITTKIGQPLTTYEILNIATNPLDTTPEEEDEWITTSTPTLVKPNMTLYMRAPGVETCLGLRSRKRALSAAPEPPYSPSPSPSNTPSPTKRTRTNKVLDDEEDDDVIILPPSPSPLRFSSSTLRPAVQPEMPLGKRTPFPLAYTCDMDALFRKVNMLPSQWTAEQKFNDVFSHLNMEYNSSTYSNSWNAWKRCPPDVLAKAITCQHRPGGEWGPIVTAFRSKK
ncbi:hypothetical protein K438DRAFT_1812604 [Mycena galopus ATCC 62051]|nr:hypothetical protein K438DRAFT_1812575 [Mycena galopus ATCC 62051]KAF8208632.1 hypothetical protein K438DRAFT_1812604 [Mycena galopus ATCC 62051]